MGSHHQRQAFYPEFQNLKLAHANPHPDRSRRIWAEKEGHEPVNALRKSRSRSIRDIISAHPVSSQVKPIPELSALSPWKVPPIVRAGRLINPTSKNCTSVDLPPQNEHSRSRIDNDLPVIDRASLRGDANGYVRHIVLVILTRSAHNTYTCLTSSLKYTPTDKEKIKFYFMFFFTRILGVLMKQLDGRQFKDLNGASHATSRSAWLHPGRERRSCLRLSLPDKRPPPEQNPLG